MFLNNSRQNCSCFVNLVYYVMAESRKPSVRCMNFCVTAFYMGVHQSAKKKKTFEAKLLQSWEQQQKFLQTQVQVWKKTLVF